MAENSWAIVDDDGTIYSGSEDDMMRVWKKIEDGIINFDGDSRNGDLMLVEIHGVRR